MDVCFSPDGKTLACAGSRGVALFGTVDFQRGLFVRGNWPYPVAFSPDSRLLAVPDRESRVVQLWDVTTNREVAVLRNPGEMPFVSFAADGKRLVSAGPAAVRIWDLAGAAEKQTLSGHSDGVSGLAFSPNGKLLASTSKDYTVRLWDSGTGEMVRELRGFDVPPQSVAFDPHGRFLVTTEYKGGGVKVWDVRSGEKLSTTPNDPAPAAYVAAFSPDGRHFMACGRLGVRVWSVDQVGPGPDGRLRLSLRELACPTQSLANSACFSPDGKLLAWAGDWNGQLASRISVWDFATGQEHSWPAHVYPYLALSFLPDNKRLALVNWDEGKIEIRDATGGQVTASFGKKDLIFGDSIHTALSPDGAWLAVGGNKALTIWDMNTHELILALPEQGGIIWSLAWSPDKNLLAVGTSQGGPILWDVPRIKSELGRIGLGW
jgi:WD40 repeat protein